MPGPARRHCIHHPQRLAFAVCMTCRNAVCQACATQWDGIYHCTACLAARRNASKERGSAAGWLTLAVGAALMLWLCTHAMVVAGALLAGLF
jgi:hypothetical protein